MLGALCSFAAVLFMMTVAVSGEAAAPDTNADRHRAHKVSCEDCHGKGPKKAVEMKQCFQCHGSYAKVAGKTKDLSPNPHDSHLGELECDVCHVGHKPNQFYCKTCHADMEISRNKSK
jgi:DnaJ-class molecular chaperone